MDATADAIVEITDSIFRATRHLRGGGLRGFGPDFTLTRCEFTTNSANSGAGMYLLGDGDGEAEVIDCSFSGNTSGANAGGAYLTMDAAFYGCTFSENSAGSNGGALWTSKGRMTVTNCTLSGNTVGGVGGGIFADALCFLGNSIVAENTDQAAFDIGAGGSVSSLGHNFIGVETLGSGQDLFDGIDGNLVGNIGSPLLPMLGPLQDNGGPTLTHAPLFGSPVIEAGDSALVTDPPFVGPDFKDQRGESRIAVAKVDIGSFEYPALEVTNTNDAGPGSLRDLLAQAQTLGGGVIAFDPAIFGVTRQTISLTSGQLITAVDITIIAPEVGLRISAGNNSRVISFNGGNSTMGRVIIADGLSTASGGGIRVAGATTSLLLNDVSVRVSSALTGGGILIDGATVTATRCDLVSNTATAGSGGGVRVTANAAADRNGGNVQVGANVNASFRDCLITGGSSDSADGGNFYVESGGKLIAEDCRIMSGIVGRGANVFNDGEIDLKRSYLGNGRASNNGGGLCNFNSGSVTNCTFSGNEALNHGGGIFNLAGTSGVLELKHCTIVKNRAKTDNTGNDLGGGIRRGSGTVRIQNCLIQENQVGPGAGAPREDLSGVIESLGYNLLGTGMNGGLAGTGDLLGTPLSPLPITYKTLGRFGGRTEVYSIGCSSAAFDAAFDAGNDAGNDAGGPATDQRGLRRRDGEAVDIGAYELQPESYDFWASYTFTPGEALAGGLDDKDDDGTVNGLEYLLGMNPLVKDFLKPLEARRDGNFLMVIVPFSPLAMSGSYRVMMSTDPESWSLNSTSEEETGCVGDAQLVEFGRDFGSATKGYGRLEFIE